ncbi:hypothetical protein DQ04_09691000 [Trypanosoma grayi]|uniref:hypothetical protein n=1 Tax=Trypanosoma grayi TaxID=71804 RepID=UPI0004F45ED6|nr:hypothetical protein DQ04_09691000 [Trypanosoma grayi]KEG07472.1 hypothetical protein DQ04_09691000 [Trypanosoma grayi]
MNQAMDAKAAADACIHSQVKFQNVPAVVKVQEEPKGPARSPVPASSSSAHFVNGTEPARLKAEGPEDGCADSPCGVASVSE